MFVPEQRFKGSTRLIAHGLLAVGLTSQNAPAQVNVEVLRGELKESGVGLKADASLTSYLGNTEGTSMGSSVLLGLSSEPHLAYFNMNGNYSRLGGRTDISNAFAHARYNLRLTESLWGEVFAQLENDRFRRIALRQLVGVGPRLELSNTEHVAAYYGAAYMLEHTRRRPDTEPIPSRPELVHRFSNYASIVANFDDDRVQLSQTIYYQPRFDALDDYRLLSTTGLDFSVTGPLTAGIFATLRFETPTPDEVKRSDFTLKNTLGLRF